MHEIHSNTQPHQISGSELLGRPEHQSGHTVFEGSGLLDKMLEQTPVSDTHPQVTDPIEAGDPLAKTWREAQGAFSPEQRRLLTLMKKQERKEDRLRHIRLMGLASMGGGTAIDEHPTTHKRYDR